MTYVLLLVGVALLAAFSALGLALYHSMTVEPLTEPDQLWKDNRVRDLDEIQAMVDELQVHIEVLKGRLQGPSMKKRCPFCDCEPDDCVCWRDA